MKLRTRRRRFTLPRLAIWTLIVASCTPAPSNGPPPTGSREGLLVPGVSQALAELRRATISDPRYDLFLSVPARPEDPIAGRITARFELADHSRGVIFDFAQQAEHVGKVTANGNPVPVEVRAEHIVVSAEALTQGANRVTIEFTAGDGPLNRSEDSLYTLFVPARARAAIPIFDQPDLKARFRLQLEIPYNWEAISNGELDEREVDGDRTLLSFRPTRPISSYLFAFVAGRFEIETFEGKTRRLRLLHRESDDEKVRANLPAIFDLHERALDWLETYTGIPYPFEKFDLAAIPAFQFGGMEHPGAIFYRDRALFLDPTATQHQILGRASLIAHETAHMWFGDLVTMEWFDDVWMKEVFANFMAAKIVHPSFPEIDHDLSFLLDHYPAAYAVDRTAGANPIRQPLENLDDAGSLYGSIIYDKAPIVMKHLEMLLGETDLRNGLRDYLDRHAYANASWTDLIDTLDRLTDEDLRVWSRVWVDQAGRPTIEVETEGDQGHLRRVRVRQSDPSGEGRVWIQPLELLIVSADDAEGARQVRAPIRLQRAEQSVAMEADFPAPDLILANGSGVGYGNFKLSTTSTKMLLDDLPGLEPPMTRAVAWITLWDSMLEGGVDPTDLIGLAIRSIETEGNEQLLQRILRYSETAFWRFLTTEERQIAAPRLESGLLARLAVASGVTLKSALFDTYRNLATTDSGVGLLSAVWHGEEEISGLPLSEQDRTSLAEALALRRVDGYEQILNLQAEEIENADRRARFDFVRPSLAAEFETREQFFFSLQDPGRRKHEPWVLDALVYLHHPLHGDESEALILPALEMLEEVRRTGDIFFPLSWLQATLGGHNSPEAAAIVRRFLDREPKLPARLEQKLLQAADPLFRAAEITGN